jgi:hypothetical protein
MTNVVCAPYPNQIDFDTYPEFTFVCVVYKPDVDCTLATGVDILHKVRTECKGDLMYQSSLLVDKLDYGHVAMYDDDIEISVSDLNKMFRIGGEHGLDLYQASIHEDSFHMHPRFLHREEGPELVDLEWAEIMMPHFSKRFYDMVKPYFNMTISGYGQDSCIWSRLVKKHGYKCCMVNSVQALHSRPITSMGRVFSNGKTALGEIKVVWDMLHDRKRNGPFL